MQAMFNLFLAGKEHGFDFSACVDISVRRALISVIFYGQNVMCRTSDSHQKLFSFPALLKQPP